MFMLDSTIVNPALPTIQRDLHFSTGGLAWVVNGYTLMAGGFLIVGGRVADLFGRRRMFVTGAVVFAVGSALSGLGRRADAAEAYRAAVKLRQALAAGSPKEAGYRRDLADSHNNLGNVLRALGERAEAEAEQRAFAAGGVELDRRQRRQRGAERFQDGRDGLIGEKRIRRQQFARPQPRRLEGLVALSRSLPRSQTLRANVLRYL